MIWDMSSIGSAPQADCASGVFPALDTDLGDDLRERRGTKRICIATPDILGPVKNGGIGTAYHHLARLLAGWGHEVVIAYVNGNASNAELMEAARDFYVGCGVAFEPIVPRPAARPLLPQFSAPTWTLYEWLRARAQPFDALHVSDYRGLGYGSLLAKSHGLAFGATHFIVHGHGPTLWAVEGNRQLLSKERELGWVFMERRSVELADTVICGSAYLLGWMREAGYAMPARSLVWPNPFPVPDTSPTASAARGARDGAPLEELVFFGRLEPRKGLVLFIDAVDRLVRQNRAPARITFVGKASTRIDGPEFIRSSTRDWPVEIRMITDFDAEEAVTYLSQPGRLAVMPSLQENSSLALTECLHAGIPFLASATGGTPELVALEDHARALVAPDHIALGERIVTAADEPLRAVRPRWDFERSLDVWLRWHAQTAPFEAAAARFAQKANIARTETPLVTVCVVHHERPELLRMAVDSVLSQNYPALEAVLVDDGSESAEALKALDATEAEFAERGWRVLRQENRYAGAARNAAAAAARGDWFLFLDDDNVLFPDAVSRLVHAAQFSGADCVPAASIRFSGRGDPRVDTGCLGTPRRFLGAARAWNRLRNVAGDTCALVRREAFEAVGGFPEEYRLWLQDMCFINRLIQADYQVEPMPDPTYYYRSNTDSSSGSTKTPFCSTEAARARVLAPYIKGLPDEERAFAAYTTGQAIDAIKPAALQPFQGTHARRTAILVSGMHRSGTSALTRILNIVGCDLPKTLSRPAPDNVTGFWESRAIMNLNQEILASAGSAWDDWRPFDKDWYTSPIADEFRERAHKLLRNEFGSSQLFVLKDPRICRLLEFWIEVVDALGAKPLVVLPIRSPLDVASSLRVRNDIDPFVGHLIWLRHVLDAEAASRSMKRAYLRYEQLLSESQALIDRLGNDLGVSWPRRSSPYVEMEVEEFLSTALHHNDSEDTSHRSNPRLSDWITTSFDIFDRWSRGEVRTEDTPDLDRIKAAFDDATPAFSRAMAAGQIAERQSRTLSKELDDSRGKAAQREDRIQALSKKLDDSRGKAAQREDRIQALSKKLDDSRGKAAQREDRIQALSKKLDDSRGKAAQREDRIQALSKKLDDSRGKAAQREDRIQALSKKLDDSRGKAAQREDRIQALSKKLDDSRGKAAQREDRIQALSKELDDSRGKAAQREDRIQALSKKLDDSRGKAAQREDRIQALSKKLDDSRGKAAQREDRIQALSKKLDDSRGKAAQREDRIQALSKKLDDSRGKAAQREDRIQALSKKLDDSRGKAAQREDRIQALSKKLDDSRGKAAQREDRIQALSKKLDDSRGKAAQREDRIQALSKKLDDSRGKAAQREDRIQALSKKLDDSRGKAAQREDRIQALSKELKISRTGHVMALAHRRSRFGIDELEVDILLNPEWIDQARQRHHRDPTLELRCNGRVVARALVDMSHNLVQMTVQPRIPTAGDVLYSIHDTVTGEALFALVTPPFRRARRVVGAVESWSSQEVRGWALDPGDPERHRRIAVHVNGLLRKVVNADKERADIVQREGFGGSPGFLWRIPEDLAVKDGTRLDVFDADTGLPLRGSPVHIESE